MDALERIQTTGILPVIKIEELDKAVPLAAALRAGDVNAIEVTVRNDIALECISAIKKAFPDMAVGAGTVLSPELAQKAVDAGAEYCVSPGFNPRTVDYCVKHGITIVPGCSSTTELELANEAGLKCVKFFPSESLGGPEALKLLAGPFPKLKFVPTGGLSLNNIGNYLKLECVAACGGSYMAKGDTIKAGNWDKITADCRKAVQTAMGFTVAHVGINHDSRAEASASADALCSLLNLDPDVRERCTFAGTLVECMDFQNYGAKGHIGFRTLNPHRAYLYLKSKGYEFIPESAQYKANGEVKFIYLKEEIGGFAVHIV